MFTLVGLTLAAVLGVGSAPVAATEGTPLVATGAVPMTDDLAADLAKLPSAAPYGAFVHFISGTRAERDSLLSDRGLQVAGRFDSVDVVYAVGTVGDVRGLTHEPSIGYLEADRALRYLGDTAPWATGARIAQQPVAGGPYVDGSGNVLDGRGVGVAVIDSGIDALHPDLVNRVGRNFKLVCSTGPLISLSTYQCAGPVVIQEMAVTDTTGGHGTHVAGIVAGDGTASRGTFTGVAPGATLYGFGTGEAISIMSEVTSFQYIIDHYEEFTPRIKVVNNSFGDGAGARYDPNSVRAKVVRALVDRGVSVLFAAGNDGGNGMYDTTSSFSKDTTPGVMSIANYDDRGTGTRTGGLHYSSSRGLSSEPTTYPDLAAPGTGVVSTCRPWLPVCHFALVPTVAWAPHYAAMTGTSMATPHVAGAAALLYQARPDLTAAQVEDVLLDTARKVRAGSPYVPDPQNPGATTSFDKGAGLLDVPAALDALGVTHLGKSPAPTTPSVTVSSPVPGAVTDGSTPLQAAGTGFDGVPQVDPPTPQAVIADDTGDAVGPGAADVRGVTMSEEGERLRVTIDVADVTDLGVHGRVVYAVRSLIDGREVTTDVVLTSSGANAVAETEGSEPEFVEALSVKHDIAADSLSFEWPISGVGNPGPGAVVHGTSVTTYSPLISDTAPGGGPGDRDARPEYGRAFSLVRADAVATPTAAVSLSVDGGRAQPAVLTGTSPSYDWASTIDTSTLSDGAHTLRATLLLDGAEAASTTVAFTVQRPTYTYAVSVTSPAADAVVPRAIVPVTGTSASDAPAALPRLVTVQVTGGGYDSGEGTAAGTDSWSHAVDFALLPAGAYAITARLYVDGVEVARHDIPVTVPAVATGTVSCAPEAQSFWAAQYDGSRSAVFTRSEADALGSRGAELSSGYFADRSALVTALLAGGKLSTLARAERQYATLLLNLAGGDLSATMSAQVGLSGAEALDPETYDTSRVGSTVDSATVWVRAQLPSGDVAGANEVATSVNKGVGLTC